MSAIEEYFRNQTVFITGGTGFLGKIIIEKLLRVCEPKKVYVIVRPKKGKTIEERIDDFFNFPCFDRVKSEFRDFKRRVCFIGGDCEAINLGISQEDEEILINETTVIIHAAANVKFDQSLRVAANANVRSTVNIITLAKKISQLKAFVYVSTAYSNCIHNEIKEEFYPPAMTHESLFSLLEITDDDTLEKLTPKLLGKWPNPYIYSKNISENVVRILGKDLPIAIVRPAIVANTAEEPMPGWIDNFYGVIGIGLGGALGIIRSYRLISRVNAYLIPVDYVANLVLASAWNIQNQNFIIYNFAGDKNNLITWGKFQEITEKFLPHIPPEKVIWKYTFTVRENKMWNDICAFFLHMIPAYIIDFVLFCIGKPTLAVKSYRKLNKSLDLISYFTTHDWDFKDRNLMDLWQKMNDEDKKMFRFNMNVFDWVKFCRDGFFGSVLYLLKVPAVQNPKITTKNIFMYIAHYTIVILFWFLVYKFVTFVIGLFI